MRGSIALSSLLVIALTSGRVLADDARLARQHFADGSKLYDLGKFRDAAREYEEAYKAKPDPALLFNIGQAYRAAGDASEAVTAYKSYLRHVPDAPNRVEVEGHIEKLQRLVDEQRRTQTSPPQGTLQPTTEPQPQAQPQPQLVATAAPAEKQPVYKKWWLWTAVGGVIVAGGVIAIAVAATTPKDASSPANTFGVSLR
ncbi:MAG TPA: tetratricopeptide repeat protein [Polyangia bacterium]